jgi:hypothetical protein
MLIEAVILVRVILCLLSTRLGTLLLCGRLSLCRKSPFIYQFKDMPLERREEVMKRWSKANLFFIKRVGFLVVKILTSFIFYSYVSSFIYIFFFFKYLKIMSYQFGWLFTKFYGPKNIGSAVIYHSSWN